jgi:hypothetical protein
MPRRKTNIDIQIGDIVFLRSGSPPLTVHALTPSADRTHIIASVVWFSEYGQVGCANIPVLCLHADKIDEVCRALIGELQ